MKIQTRFECLTPDGKTEIVVGDTPVRSTPTADNPYDTTQYMGRLRLESSGETVNQRSENTFETISGVKLIKSE